jgi:hypothetical protein
VDTIAAEVTTDRAPVYPRVLDELVPSALHVAARYANNPVEADHGRLKARLRPMRGLKRHRSARFLAAGHAFIQNLRRGHYEIATDAPARHQLRIAFHSLAATIDPQSMRIILRRCPGMTQRNSATAWLGAGRPAPSRRSPGLKITSVAPGGQRASAEPWRQPAPRPAGHGSRDGSGPIAGTGHTIPVQARSGSVRFTEYSFGSVRVDGVTYDHDLIIDRGKIRKRKKAASKRFRGAYGHTPLSIAEDIPWRCRRLVIGTGADGALPVMKQVQEEARRRNVDLVVLPTAEAIGVLTGTTKDTNAVLHVTC